MAHPVRRIYQVVVLPDQDNGKALASHVAVTALSPREGLMQLLGSLRRVNMTDRGGLIRELHELGRIAEVIPVRQLTIPHRYDRLDEVHQIIRQDLQQP